MGGRCDAIDQERGDIADGDVDGLGAEAIGELDEAFGKALADRDAKGDADEIGVFELDAGALVAVVKEGVEAGGFQPDRNLFAAEAEGLFTDVGNGNDDGEGGDGGREGEGWVGAYRCASSREVSGGLLDGSGEDALDADAVGAHDGGDFLAGGVEDAGAHGLGVFVAELEDMADLDGLAEAEGAAVDWVGLALVDVADVFGDGPGEVAAGGDVAQMVVELIGAGDEVLAVDEGGVEDDEGGVEVEELGLLVGVEALGRGERGGGVEAGVVFERPGGQRGEADGAEEAGGTLEVLLELFGGSWGAANRRREAFWSLVSLTW